MSHEPNMQCPSCGRREIEETEMLTRRGIRVYVCGYCGLGAFSRVELFERAKKFSQVGRAAGRTETQHA